MIRNTLLAALLGLGAVGASSICDLCLRPAEGQTGSPAMASPGQPQLQPKIVAFHVKGMTCGGCVYGVRKVLTRLPGVLKADVSYEQSSAIVTYDPAKVTVDKMTAAIGTLGYTATVTKA
jgi:periplasmic mercuric ion binding protein